MEFELTFNGTPYEFAEMILNWPDQNSSDYLRPIVTLTASLLHATPGMVMLSVPFTNPYGDGAGSITVQRISAEKSMLTVRAKDTDWPDLAGWWDSLHEHMQREGWIPGVVGLEPKKPPSGAELGDWFEYYHAMKRTGRKYTLKQLADDVGYSYSYVRRLHAAWVQSHQLFREEGRHGRCDDES